MIKQDELEIVKYILSHLKNNPLDKEILHINIPHGKFHERRLNYILEKWHSRGWLGGASSIFNDWLEVSPKVIIEWYKEKTNE